MDPELEIEERTWGWREGGDIFFGLCSCLRSPCLFALQLDRTIGPLCLPFAQFSPAFSRISPWRFPKNFRRQYPPCTTSGCVSRENAFWRKSTGRNLHIFPAVEPTHLGLDTPPSSGFELKGSFLQDLSGWLLLQDVECTLQPASKWVFWPSLIPCAQMGLESFKCLCKGEGYT